MLYRVRQFMKGILSYYQKEDLTMIDLYLSEKERELFMQLPRYERRHALSTAKTLKEFNIVMDEHIILKAALLHDIGKINSDIGLIKKSILVLMDSFFPVLSYRLAKKNNMFNVYYNHSEIGAKLLKQIGVNEKIILLVKYHHKPGSTNIYGVDLLHKADGLN